MDFDDNLVKIPKFLSLLVEIVGQIPEDSETTLLAVHALGHLVGTGGSPCAESTKVVINQAIRCEKLVLLNYFYTFPSSWIVEQGSHVLGGVMLCRALVENAPVLFQSNLIKLVRILLPLSFSKNVCNEENYYLLI